MPDRVLVTGSTGKTGSAVVRRLSQAGVDVLAGTRRPTRQGDVRFEWRDPATHEPVLDGVDAVYLVAPTDTPASLATMQPFLTVAARRGCRLVLLSASSLPAGAPMIGEVHAWLADHAQHWMALRPSWFMQNFVTQHLDGILRQGAIYSATGCGRVPFIDAEDIAAAATEVLTTDFDPGAAPVLTGPEALTYDEVARMIADVSGRDVRHIPLSVADLASRYEEFGLPPEYAVLLADMDATIAEGAENRVTGDVERISRRPPNTLKGFLATHRDEFRG